MHDGKDVDFTLMHDGKDVDFTSARDGKDVGFTWKSARSQFYAMPKLKNVDFKARKEKILISH